MISRKSAKLIAATYSKHFRSNMSRRSARGWAHTLNEDEINNFFYEEEYEPWFVSIMRTVVYRETTETLERAIMQLHTGETLVTATPESSWDRRRELGQQLLRKMAEDILKHYAEIPHFGIPLNSDDHLKKAAIEAHNKLNRPAEEILQKLTAQLELDGYIYKKGKLYPVESSVINEQEEQTYLETLVTDADLQDPTIITHHLHLSEQAYSEQRWNDCISNARNFLEAILEQVAFAHHFKKYGSDLPANVVGRPVNVREFLEKEGVIDTVEKDAIAKIYGLISNTGSHPNIAAKHQARLMRNLALTVSQYLLLSR